MVAKETNTFYYENFNLIVFIQIVRSVTKNNTDLNYGDETGRRNTPAVIGYWTPTNGNNTRPAISYNNTGGYGYASTEKISLKAASYLMNFLPYILAV